MLVGLSPEDLPQFVHEQASKIVAAQNPGVQVLAAQALSELTQHRWVAEGAFWALHNAARNENPTVQEERALRRGAMAIVGLVADTREVAGSEILSSFINGAASARGITDRLDPDLQPFSSLVAGTFARSLPRAMVSIATTEVVGDIARDPSRRTDVSRVVSSARSVMPFGCLRFVDEMGLVISRRGRLRA